ncbi:DUF2510 domain-containing protein, partial [Streptomyces sp. NPDC059015]|uniref:DUF2510 domain-containing protein n=1 Tax=Streptomyces sp. NPDC059015 TaxID=3346698 RepID=UPI0036B315B2
MGRPDEHDDRSPYACRPGGPPGRYPDPGTPTRERRWDGRAWTGHTRTSGARSRRPPHRPSPRPCRSPAGSGPAGYRQRGDSRAPRPERSWWTRSPPVPSSSATATNGRRRCPRWAA